MPDALPWYVLINVHAGSGQAEMKWEQAKRSLADFQFERIWLAEHDTITDRVMQAIANGARRFVVVGGDGTHHHFINGVLQQAYCPGTDITYALLPSGSGNDWRRTYSIPTQVPKWVNMFRAQRTFEQDAGHIEATAENGSLLTRYYANVAGLGYDAYVIRHLYQNGVTALGGWRYFRAIYSCLKEYKASVLEVKAGEKQVEDAFYSLNIGITRYSGGGMQFVPHAQPDDGKLAYTLINPIPSWRVAINTPWLYTPFFDRHPLTQTGNVPEIAFTHRDHPSWIEADGELIGQTPARIKVVPKALRFLVPTSFLP